MALSYCHPQTPLCQTMWCPEHAWPPRQAPSCVRLGFAVTWTHLCSVPPPRQVRSPPAASSPSHSCPGDSTRGHSGLRHPADGQSRVLARLPHRHCSSNSRNATPLLGVFTKTRRCCFQSREASLLHNRTWHPHRQGLDG